MTRMTDIAREAGVSLSTVSYTLSGKRPISADTRRRVEQAIERLDYHPAAAARALALRRTSTLGAAVPRRPGVDGQVIMEFVGAFLTAADQHDQDILLVTAEDHAHTRRVVDEGKVDALLVMDIVEDDPRIALLSQLSRPVVLVGYPERSGGLSRVDFDFRAAAALGVSELHASGARRIAMLRPPSAADPVMPTYAHRAIVGYEEACRAHGIDVRMLEASADPADLLDMARTHLLGPDRVDGLLVHHERALPALARACTAGGIAVPEDLQVVAIAPHDIAENGPWAVSSVDLPIPEIGARAVDMALALIESPGAAALSHLIAPTFTPRGTTRTH